MENLLDQLAQVAREETLEAKRRLDERWDRLAAGTASEAETDELLGLADASGEAHEAYQAFRPLGTGFEQQVASAILRQQALEQQELEQELAPTREATEAAAPSRARFGTYLYGALSAVMAASLAVLFLLPLRPMPHFILQELPSMQANRGPSEIPLGAPIVADGMYLDLVAIAAFEPEILPAAQLFVARPGEPLELCASGPRIAANGTVSFYPKIGTDLELPPGESTLVLVLGRPGALPTGDELLRAVQRGGESNKNWQVLVQPVIKVP